MNTKKRQNIIFASSLITVFLLFFGGLNKVFFYFKEIISLSTILSLALGMFVLSWVALVIYLILDRIKNYFAR